MSAVERHALIEGACSGLGTPLGSPWAPSDPGYLDLTGTVPFDPAKARAMLAEAGYGNGLALTIKTPQMADTTRTAEVLQAMLADVGVMLTIEPSEFPAKWIDDVFLKHDYEVTVIDHAEPMDIDIYSRPTYYFGYHNPAFDALVAKAEATAAETARTAACGEAQRILAADVPALCLFDVPRLNVWDAELRGLWKDEPLPQVLVRNASWSE